jgi:hypothetical protein
MKFKMLASSIAIRGAMSQLPPQTKVFHTNGVYKQLAAMAWYAMFLLKIALYNLLKKTGARLNFKIALISVHIDTEP